MFAHMQSIRALPIRVAAACAVAAIGAGTRAADFGVTHSTTTPAVTTQVIGIAGPVNTAATASSPASAVKVSTSVEGGQDPSGPNRNGTGGPAKVKPGVGPGQGKGIESRGPAPR